MDFVESYVYYEFVKLYFSEITHTHTYRQVQEGLLWDFLSHQKGPFLWSWWNLLGLLGLFRKDCCFCQGSLFTQSDFFIWLLLLEIIVLVKNCQKIWKYSSMKGHVVDCHRWGVFIHRTYVEVILDVTISHWLGPWSKDILKF